LLVGSLPSTLQCRSFGSYSEGALVRLAVVTCESSCIAEELVAVAVVGASVAVVQVVVWSRQLF